MKENEIKKKVKKASFTEQQMNEIEKAMEDSGHRNFSEYVLDITRQRNNPADAEIKRNMQLRYKCSQVMTCYNQIKAGIHINGNLENLKKEIDSLCQDLL